MDRRGFLFAAALAATPIASPLAQGKRQPRIALVFINTPAGGMRSHPYDRAFVRGLAERGWVEDRDLTIARRSAEGAYERLPAIVREVLALPVDVIVTVGPGVGAARRATQTVPIVAVSTDGLVESGAVASLARPGGNVTGLTFEVGLTQLNAKRLQLLKELAPRSKRVAYLGVVGTRDDEERIVLEAMDAAARALGLELKRYDLRRRDDYAPAFAAIERDGADALFIDATAVAVGFAGPIVDFAARRRLPAIYAFRAGPEAGGLISYGADLPDLFRRAAGYVDRILKGAKPGDLPLEQPAKFDLVINGATAQALGLAIPASLRAVAEIL